MGLLTVPLTAQLSKKVGEMIKHGKAANKADLARKALQYYIEEQAILDVLKAEQEVRDGKLLRDNLDALARKI